MYYSCLIFSGIGVSPVFITFPIIVQKHFSRNRALTSSISWSGSSIGQILTPMVIYFLIDTYGWRWAMRIQAAIMLNILALAWLMRTTTNFQQQPSQSGIRKLKENFAGMILMLLDKTFILRSLVRMLGDFTLTTLYVHTPSRAQSLGIDTKWATFLLSVTGFCNLGARCVCLQYHFPYLTLCTAKVNMVDNSIVNLCKSCY